MQKGQEQFFKFLMDCVQPGKEEAAKALLRKSFQRQDAGTFSQTDLDSFQREIIKLLKPERKDEVVAIMNQFGGIHVSP